MNDKNMTGNRRFPILIIIINVLLVLGILAGMIFEGLMAAIIGTLIVLSSAAISVYLIRSSSLKFRDRVLDQAVGLSTEYQQYMSQWEYPFALLSSNMRVIWFNEAFRRLMKYQDVKGKSIEELGIEWGTDKPDWDPISKQIHLEELDYRAIMTRIRLRDEAENPTEGSYTQVFSLSLQDITRELTLERENRDQQSVVSLIYVDNYDQILNSMDENLRPLLEANIYRSLSDLSASLSGIMTRLERDRFQIIFPRKSLDILYEDHFHILEQVKELGSGRYQTTISMGVGVDPSIDKARRYARMGVDLALGRGGDQAVVKTKDEQKFFGGMSTSVENTTRVRARLTAYALKELIEASDHVLIMGHANPDLDAFGSALGMYRAVYEMKKPVNIVMSAEKHAAVDYLYRQVSENRQYQGLLIDREEAQRYCGRESRWIPRTLPSRQAFGPLRPPPTCDARVPTAFAYERCSRTIWVTTRPRPRWWREPRCGRMRSPSPPGPPSCPTLPLWRPRQRMSCWISTASWLPLSSPRWIISRSTSAPVLGAR